MKEVVHCKEVPYEEGAHGRDYGMHSMINYFKSLVSSHVTYESFAQHLNLQFS